MDMLYMVILGKDWKWKSKKNYLINVLESILFFQRHWVFLQVEPVADALPGPLFGGRRLGKRQGLADMGQHWDIMGRTKKGSMAISQRAMTPGKYRCCEIGC